MTDTVTAINGYQRLTVRPLQASTSLRVVLRACVCEGGPWQKSLKVWEKPRTPLAECTLLANNVTSVALTSFFYSFCCRDLEKKLPSSNAQANKVTIIKRKRIPASWKPQQIENMSHMIPSAGWRKHAGGQDTFPPKLSSQSLWWEL